MLTSVYWKKREGGGFRFAERENKRFFVEIDLFFYLQIEEINLWRINYFTPLIERFMKRHLPECHGIELELSISIIREDGR